jgi:hypothetical protein
MIFIGIDPGLDGAVAIKDMETNEVIIVDTPVYEIEKKKVRKLKVPKIKDDGTVQKTAIKPGIKREYDEAAMRDILKPYGMGKATVFAALEVSQAMPDQGRTSMFETGVGFGIWRGMLTALEIPYVRVHPKTWQKTLGYLKGPTKGQSYAIASRLYPGQEFRGPRGGVKDGRTDAALIMTHAERQCPNQK